MEMKPKRKRISSASGAASQVRYQVRLCLEFWQDGSLAQPGRGEQGNKGDGIRAEGPEGRANRAEA